MTELQCLSLVCLYAEGPGVPCEQHCGRCGEPLVRRWAAADDRDEAAVAPGMQQVHTSDAEGHKSSGPVAAAVAERDAASAKREQGALVQDGRRSAMEAAVVAAAGRS